MTCKECTCYVDGHSKNGGRLPAGRGLCTMYNQDVSYDGNCAACMSVNSKGTKRSYTPNVATNNNKNTYAKPRKGMKAWAIVCFVFAALYGLISLGVGSMLLGMTAFFGVLGIMFRSVYKELHADRETGC